MKVADLVDDSDAAKRARVLGALKDPAHKDDRDHVDIIIALGMAKEGFDWIWCEHALTIGYRSSLTEIVQIIGRATRDADGKERARFTNLIAEPTAEQSAVAEAVNDMLKAISASLLMEQVLAPRYEFTPRNAGAQEGFDYGPDGYVDGGKNLGVNKETGEVHIEINGLAKPKSKEGQAHLQGRPERGHRRLHPGQAGARARHAGQGKHDSRGTDHRAPGQDRARALPGAERCRPGSGAPARHCRHQHHPAGQAGADTPDQVQPPIATPDGDDGGTPAKGNTDLIDGVRKFINVRDLDIDLIDRINPFEAAYAVLAKTMDEKSLRQIQASIAGKNIKITEDEARELAKRALQFKNERGRVPDINSADAWEKRMAEGVAAFARYRAQAKAAQAQGGAGNG